MNFISNTSQKNFSDYKTFYTKVHEDKDWMLINHPHYGLDIIHWHKKTDAFINNSSYCPKCKEKVPEHLLAIMLIGNIDV